MNHKDPIKKDNMTRRTLKFIKLKNPHLPVAKILENIARPDEADDKAQGKWTGVQSANSK